MWGAAANHLSPQTARDLAVYLSTLYPESANDGDAGLAAEDKKFIAREIRPPIFPHALHVTARMLRVLPLRGRRNSSFGRPVVPLLEKTARAMGRRISCGRSGPDAWNCDPIVQQRN